MQDGEIDRLLSNFEDVIVKMEKCKRDNRRGCDKMKEASLDREYDRAKLSLKAALKRA